MSGADERRARAISAAATLARGHGLEPHDPIVLQDWNNTIVHLRPLPLVAKVSTSPLTRQSRSPAREVDAAAYLAGRDTPVIPPSALLPPGPHQLEGVLVTFWEHCEGVAAGEADAREAGDALSTVHRAFTGYSVELPSFRDQVEDVGAVLADEDALVALPPEDRRFLRDRRDRLVEEIAAFDADERVLHGEAHLANVMRTPERLLWFDFESVCRGPLEWDLSALPEPALAAFGAYDPRLLDLMRRLRSLCVAVWCWVQPDRAPEVAEAARFHLRLQRESD